MNNGKLIIIDGNSLINRAYYAMQRPMITKDGIYTQGIYGFLNMILKIMDENDPEYMAVAWDLKAPTFRHKAYSEYKAGRKKMPPELAMEFPIMKDLLSAMSIKNIEFEGFEADDIIGTISRMGEEEGLDPLIITGDKDALQLASDTTKVMITRRGISQFDLYDRDAMIERYELTPEQFIDLKGLMGDNSDNIPGIPGVGEKTGIKLLKQFGSTAELLRRTDEIKAKGLRTKVQDNIQLAMMSRKLVEIHRNVPLDIEIEDLRVGDYDYDGLVEILTKLEFNSFLKRMSLENNAPLPEVEEKEYNRRMIIRREDLSKIEEVPDGSRVTILVFTNGDHVEKPFNEGMGFLYDTDYYYIDFGAGIQKPLIELLNKKKFKYAGSNLVYDYYALMRHGLEYPETGFDTAIFEYVKDPSKSNYDLKVLAADYLRQDMESFEEFRKNNAQTDIFSSSTDRNSDYGFLWCTVVDKISELQGRVADKTIDTLCRRVEFPMIAAIASMEASGVSVDKDTIEEISEKLSAEIELLKNDIFNITGEEFNINSPKQLGVVLFENMGLPAGKKTKTGYSTNADVLEKIRDKSPVIDMILQYRTLTKLRSTYAEGLKPLIGSDGKVRAHFRQTVTATGRLSCTEPNLQNIPVRDELGRQFRKAFKAGEGSVFVGSDYSQIELRVLAHLSGDENLIEAFNNGADIHRNTASRVFDIPYDEVTSSDRSRAKAVNFGVVYGMSGFGLSEEIKVSVKDAEKYIKDYFDKHEQVKRFMDEAIEDCKEKGYSETVLGRKRYIPEIHSSNFRVRKLGERLAMNSPIQGSAADIIKLAMVSVTRELIDKGYRARPVLQIHDELIIQVPDDEREAVKEILVRNMEEAVDLRVKLLCDVNCADSWYSLK